MMFSPRRLLGLLAVLAFAAGARPAAATTTTVYGSGNPIVEWNQATTGTLNLYPNYSTTTGQTNVSGIGSIVAASNAAFTGGAGCTASPAQTSNIIDFSDVYAPAAGKTTGCDYKNALSIGVTTNDTNGWNVTELLQLGPGAGIYLCGIPNGTMYTGTPSAASPMTGSSATTTSASINETTCAGTGQLTIGAGSATPTAQTIIATNTGSGTFYMGQDVLMLLTNTTYASGAYSDTMTVTLTMN
ncbi:MAG TPA: hypothetical protein VMD91_07905 [Candidatus Sulfotelmatobacter sp.]|nr:hypothetical protein [Candidatus Sulfotelmatobacter sp.]